MSVKQKRRRLLIATVVVVLLIGGAWWYWPRADRRFVGKWVDVSDPGVTMDLRGNGNAYLETRRPPPYRNVRIWTVWRFDGDAIRVGKTSTPSVLSPIFWTAWNRLTGDAGINHEVIYHVDRIEENQLWLATNGIAQNGKLVVVRYEFKRVED